MEEPSIIRLILDLCEARHAPPERAWMLDLHDGWQVGVHRGLTQALMRGQVVAPGWALAWRHGALCWAQAPRQVPEAACDEDELRAALVKALQDAREGKRPPRPRPSIREHLIGTLRTGRGDPLPVVVACKLLGHVRSASPAPRPTPPHASRGGSRGRERGPGVGTGKIVRPARSQAARRASPGTPTPPGRGGSSPG